ncbi:MAG: cytochrome c biogenesis protein CcsA [Candidatus Bathyarchaeota archaeon]|nr:cytochrome c biogenesis protein CcsA [Candidatus Bathyarchaeota archaeon]
MEITDILLYASTFIVMLDIFNIRRKNETTFLNERLPTIAAACVLVCFKYLYMASAYITNDFRIADVYYYSSSGLGFMERLYATWAGSGGSWLFMAFLYAAGYLIIRLSQGENKEHYPVYQFLNVLFMFILVVLLYNNPLETLTFTPIEGKGLNPLLKTPWMLIHPPIVFIGYVMAFFSMAFTFGKDASSPRLSRGLAAIAWLFLTLGIAIGGVWAYEVLGWGGYWGWDPVETSSLVPWITLTAYFHMISLVTKTKSMSQDFMNMVTSALIIFATAITRGGLAQSVHDFGESPIGYVLLTMMVVVIAYFVINKRRKGYSLFEFEFNTDSVYSTAMSLSFLSLVMIAVVCMWGIIFPIVNSGLTGGDVSMDIEFFNKWCYPFVLLFLAGLIGCHLSDKLTVKTYGGVLGGIIVLGFIGAFIGFPTPNMLANLGIPMTIAAMLAVTYNTVTSLMRKPNSRTVSRGLIHLGTTLIMAGILVGNSLTTDYGEIVAVPDSSKSLGDITLEFGEFTIIEPFGEILTSTAPMEVGHEAAGLMIPITVRDGNTELTEDVYIMLYNIHGVVTRPTVVRSLGYDVYLVLHQTQTVYRSLAHTLGGMPFAPDEFVVSVIKFPLMNLIWLGTILMSIGILVPITRMRKSPE